MKLTICAVCILLYRGKAKLSVVSLEPTKFFSFAELANLNFTVKKGRRKRPFLLFQAPFNVFVVVSFNFTLMCLLMLFLAF